MSEKEDTPPEEEAPKEPVEATQPDNETPEENNDPPEEPNEVEQKIEDNPYPVNDEYMNTMPQINENKKFYDDSMGQKASTTHNNFYPGHRLDNLGTTREYGMKKYAELASNWDDRFHVSASINNRKSHTFYKQFFGKPTRSNERLVLKPKKQIDPFLENDTKSRFPRYSRIYAERKVDKEFNWVDNFSVTHSKNNRDVHRTYKEYFDKPVQYNGLITVATTKGVADASVMSKISTKKPTATVHILREDRTNKYALKRIIQKSVHYTGMIPFLRDHNEKYTSGNRALRRQKKGRVKSVANHNKSKEYGWHQVGYPISMHNEKNHQSKKLKFEDL